MNKIHGKLSENGLGHFFEREVAEVTAFGRDVSKLKKATRGRGCWYPADTRKLYFGYPLE
jgi:hypothetical protein